MIQRLPMLIGLFIMMPAAMGCEAHTTVLTRLRLPEHGSFSRDHLHVRVLRASSFSAHLNLSDGKCPSYPELRPQEAAGSISAVKDGFLLTQNAIPTVPEFCLAAWYDANGNDVIDAGDGLGHLEAPYAAQPSRFFSSNRYHSPPVVLRRVP